MEVARDLTYERRGAQKNKTYEALSLARSLIVTSG
jgi:hypothetical protein